MESETFDSVEHLWEDLLPSCWTNTVFVTPWWMKTWWKYFREDCEMHLLYLKEGETVLGLAPLRSRGGSMYFIGNSDVCDYTDFLVPRGREEQFYSRLWGYIESADVRILDLKSVPVGSPTLDYIPALAKQSGCTVSLEIEDQTPVINLPSTWENYLSGLTKKNRHELRRKLRRLERTENIVHCSNSNVEMIDHELKDFIRLLQESSLDKAAFMTAEREGFFIDIAREMSAKNGVRLSFLEIDGKRVSSCMNFDYEGSYLLYNSGYDPQYSHLSVGLLNKVLSIKDAISRGRQSFDFLRGTERYKYELGAHDQAIYRIVVRF